MDQSGVEYGPTAIELPIRSKLRIAGQEREAARGATFERRSPADGRLVGVYADADLGDVQEAITAARAEFDTGSWARADAAHRAGILREAARLAGERADRLAETASWEVGKPLAQARGEVQQLIAALEYCAATALETEAEEERGRSERGTATVKPEPIGVVAVITSYNFPINLLTAKVPYALAVGCTVIVKPSGLSAGTAAEFCRLFADAGVPGGALQCVTTTSRSAVHELVVSPDVDKIAFTGSTATGQALMRDGAETMKQLTLELGGKGPIVVFEDADLDAVQSAIFTSIFQNAGQVCTAGSRLIVHESVHDEMLERVLAVAAAQRVGHPADPETTMGPVADEGLMHRIAEHVDWAQEDGAKLVFGGHRVTGEGYDNGWYFPPTVIDGVAPGSRLDQQEVFGPVLAVMTFATEEEAVAIANGTEFGLKAQVWTRDTERLRRVLSAMRAGMVYGNTAVATVPQVGMPFGGVKMSGYGREYGREGLESFLVKKGVFIAS